MSPPQPHLEIVTRRVVTAFLVSPFSWQFPPPVWQLHRILKASIRSLSGTICAVFFYAAKELPRSVRFVEWLHAAAWNVKLKIGQSIRGIARLKKPTLNFSRNLTKLFLTSWKNGFVTMPFPFHSKFFGRNLWMQCLLHVGLCLRNQCLPKRLLIYSQKRTKAT